jgi:hypothetical protein
MTGKDLEGRLRAVLQADAERAPLRSPLTPPGGTSQQRARHVPRKRWVAGVGVPAVAAGLIAGLIVYGPGSVPSAAAATPPMLIYHQTGAPALTPLLSALAAKSRTLPPLRVSPGEYLYQETESWDLSVSVSNHVASSQVIPVLKQVWSTSSGGPRRDIERQAKPVSPSPLTAAEEAATRNAVTYGAATNVPVDPSAPMTSTHDLPLNPMALFRKLATVGGGHGAQVSSQIDVGRALNNLMIYLEYSPPSPSLLSSTYHMLALIPGVSDAGRVTDRAGRHGIAIAVPVGGSGYEHSYRLIVDPNSGRLLDFEDIQIDPSGVNIPTPFVFHYVVFVRSALASDLSKP